MTTTRHRFSSGAGFGDPYAGFTLEIDRDGNRDPFRVDPTDSHVLADLLDHEHYTPDDVDADALLDVGLGYLAIEEYESAVDAFARVVWFAPESRAAIEAWVNRGVAHGQIGEYDEAIGAYREALSLDPDPGVAAVAETNLAYALWESGDSSNPLEHAERAVELDARLADAWYNLGFLYNERGLAEDAVRALETAERLGFDRTLVREEVQHARERLGEYEVVETEEAVEVDGAIETDTDTGAREGSEREAVEADPVEGEAAGGSASRERLGAR
jgi:tetratricopeptide (TPR) repeat protein